MPRAPRLSASVVWDTLLNNKDSRDLRAEPAGAHRHSTASTWPANRHPFPGDPAQGTPLACVAVAAGESVTVVEGTALLWGGGWWPTPQVSRPVEDKWRPCPWSAPSFPHPGLLPPHEGLIPEHARMPSLELLPPACSSDPGVHTRGGPDAHSKRK